MNQIQYFKLVGLSALESFTGQPIFEDMNRRDVLFASSIGLIAGCIGDDNGDDDPPDDGDDQADVEDGDQGDGEDDEEEVGGDDEGHEDPPDDSDNGDDDRGEDEEGNNDADQDDEEEDEPKPEFSVVALSIEPEDVNARNPVTITITVENEGEADGTFEEDILINGDLFEPIEIRLDSKESETIEFDYTPAAKGNYEVEIASLSESFEAVVTEVGGVIQEDETWGAADSPLEVTDSVQVPEGVTLTIEPGVWIQSSDDLGRDSVFRLHGEIIAEGIEDKEIIIDGRGNSGTFFDADGSDSDSYLSAEYCHISDGGEFWMRGNGTFDLRYSTLENVDGSNVWYPFGNEGGSIDIEYNTFLNSGGFAIGHRGDTTVNIRYKLFKGWDRVVYGWFNQNWASYGDSETVVEYNSFEDMGGNPVLKLPPNYNAAAMTGTNNWWGDDRCRGN